MKKSGSSNDDDGIAPDEEKMAWPEGSYFVGSFMWGFTVFI